MIPALRSSVARGGLRFRPASAATTVSVTPATASLGEGQTVQLSADVTNPSGTTTWASSDTDVATVSSSGLVTWVGAGSATITATNNGVSDGCAVTAYAALAAGAITEGTHTASQINATASAATGGSGSYTYQWYGDASPIGGQTTLTLAWTGRSASTAYAVHLVATDSVTGLTVTYSAVGMTTEAAGAGVTLSGSGFGTKATAAPRFFSTFEEDAVGTSAVSAGLDSFNGSSAAVEVSDARCHSGTRAMRWLLEGINDYPTAGRSMPGGLDGYLGHWVYWEVTGTVTLSHIFKWMRGGSGTVYHGSPNYVISLRPFSGEDRHQFSSGGDNFCNNGVDIIDTGGSNQAPHGQGWHFVEAKLRFSSSPGVADGFFSWLVDGVENPGLTNAVTRGSGETGEMEWFSTAICGVDQRGDSATYDMSVDEVLIDTTFARVIATDSQTYGSSTKWAPQAPSAWSDTEITIDGPNWSDLAPGSTAYFHVFDADDNHVSAHAATVPS